MMPVSKVAEEQVPCAAKREWALSCSFWIQTTNCLGEASKIPGANGEQHLQEIKSVSDNGVPECWDNLKKVVKIGMLNTPAPIPQVPPRSPPKTPDTPAPSLLIHIVFVGQCQMCTCKGCRWKRTALEGFITEAIMELQQITEWGPKRVCTQNLSFVQSAPVADLPTLQIPKVETILEMQISIHMLPSLQFFFSKHSGVYHSQRQNRDEKESRKLSYSHWRFVCRWRGNLDPAHGWPFGGV